MWLRLGHRRLASVTSRAIPSGYAIHIVETHETRDTTAIVATSDGVEVCNATLVWRLGDGPASVEVTRVHTDVAHRRRGLASAALAAALRVAGAAGAEYAVTEIDADDPAAAACLLRVGFEPELTGPGQAAAWDRLLATDSGRRRLL